MKDYIRQSNYSQDHMTGKKGVHTDIRMATLVADLLCDEYDFTPLDHEARVVLLADLETLFKAVLDMGWHEHTGDWDFEVRVEGEGFAYRNYNTFPGWNQEITACVDAPQLKTMSFEDEDFENRPGVEEEVTFEVDNLRTITIEECG